LVLNRQSAMKVGASDSKEKKKKDSRRAKTDRGEDDDQEWSCLASFGVLVTY